MKSSPFTKAHLRALEFLPADGSWIENPKRNIAPALHSLWFLHRDLAVNEWGHIGPRGEYLTRWRLTPAGIAAKAAQTASAA